MPKSLHLSHSRYDSTALFRIIVRASEWSIVYQGTLCLVVPTFGKCIHAPLCKNMTTMDGGNAVRGTMPESSMFLQSLDRQYLRDLAFIKVPTLLVYFGTLIFAKSLISASSLKGNAEWIFITILIPTRK